MAPDMSFLEDAPMYVPLPQNFAKDACDAVSFKEQLEPRHISLVDYVSPPASIQDIWDMKDDALPQGSPPGLELSDGVTFESPDAQGTLDFFEACGTEEHIKTGTLDFFQPTGTEEQLCNTGTLDFFQPEEHINNDTLNFFQPAGTDEHINKEIVFFFGQEVAKLTLQATGDNNRWWTMTNFPVTCPLSGFPINLLPYPPFKLRRLGGKSKSNELVDGKFLALHLISTGSWMVSGRCLQLAEVVELGQYLRRCKLGSLRPEHALALAHDANNPELSIMERSRAAQELNQLRSAAAEELSKLRNIQEQRLLQMYQKFWKEKKKARSKAKAVYRQGGRGASTASAASAA